MKGFKGIKYNFSGELNDVQDLLRKYNLEKTLIRINQESHKIFSSDEVVNWVSYNKIPRGSTVGVKQETVIMPWSLIDLSYYMIRFSNDYRGKNIEIDEELYVLYDAVLGYKQREERIFLDCQRKEDKKDFFFYLWGFAGEQFKTQNLLSVFDNQSRDLYILLDINDSNKFDLKGYIKKETGLSWENIETYLLLAWFWFTQVDNLDDILNQKCFKDKIDKVEFEKLINRYTCDYNEIRKSKLGRQILYIKPYVRTQRGKVISVNTYLNLFLCEHSILWILRDHFKNLGKSDFVNYFGELFEKYFEELLKETLNENEYERIQECTTKRADWRLCIGEYKFLIEQKSSTISLLAKQQTTDIDKIKKYVGDTIIKALRQLDNTEKEFGDGKYIKIILLYEDYIKSELLEQIMLMSDCEVENDKYYWLVSINELESLLNVAKNNRGIFFKIISERIKREISDSNEGKSIEQLLNENEINENGYLKQQKFMKYKELIKNNVREYIGEED